MDQASADDLATLVVQSMEADKRTTYFGEGKFCIWLFLDALYKQGFEISVRKK